MQRLSTLLILLLLLGCGSDHPSQPGTAGSFVIPGLTAARPYKLIGTHYAGRFRVINLLIDSTGLTPDRIVALAKLARQHECPTYQECRSVVFWSSQRACTLFNNRSSDSARKNYAPLVEHCVAVLRSTDGVLELYPAVNDDSRRLDGRKHRPEQVYYNLNAL